MKTVSLPTSHTAHSGRSNSTGLWGCDHSERVKTTAGRKTRGGGALPGTAPDGGADNGVSSWQKCC